MGLPAEKRNDFSSFIDRRNLGPGDSLRYNVFTHIIENQTDRAVEHVQEYCEKHPEFPIFKSKVEKNAVHAIDLINAIQSKREFLGSRYLTMAKQQELHEKLKFHIGELHQTLKRMEKVYNDLMIQDVRSTVMVLKSFSYGLFAVVALALFYDLVIDGDFHRILKWLDQIVLGLTHWLF